MQVQQKHCKSHYEFGDGGVRCRFLWIIPAAAKSWQIRFVVSWYVKQSSGAISRDKAIRTGNAVISPADCVRNLRMHLEAQLLMTAHIAKVFQACLFHIGRLRQVQRLLGCDFTAQLVSAAVQSKIKYGNALQAGLTIACTAPLKRVTNETAHKVISL
jgi:hypothetical protein